MKTPKSVQRLPIGSVLVLLVIVGLVAIYVGFNATTSLSDCRQKQKLSSARQQLLQSFLMELGKPMTEEDFLHLINANFRSNHIVKETGNQISVDDVVFVFANDKLVKVTSLSDAD